MDTRENFKRTTLRLPADLYERLEEAAGKAKSVNAVIVEALEEKYPAPKMQPSGFVEMMAAYVSQADTLQDMKARAKEANKVFKSFKETQHVSILVFDDVGAGVMGQRMIVNGVHTLALTPFNPSPSPDEQ